MKDNFCKLSCDKCCYLGKCVIEKERKEKKTVIFCNTQNEQEVK